jgi:hypothetical protein
VVVVVVAVVVAAVVVVVVVVVVVAEAAVVSYKHSEPPLQTGVYGDPTKSYNKSWGSFIMLNLPQVHSLVT